MLADILNEIEKVSDLSVTALSSDVLGEQIIYNIVPLSDDGVITENRLELNIICNSLKKADETDKAIRKALLSIGDLKKFNIQDIFINGGGTLESEIGVHRFINYQITEKS